jgi:hypothetical protein
LKPLHRGWSSHAKQHLSAAPEQGFCRHRPGLLQRQLDAMAGIPTKHRHYLSSNFNFQ